MGGNISIIDTIIVTGYMVAIIASGVIVGFKKNTSSEHFFSGHAR